MKKRKKIKKKQKKIQIYEKTEKSLVRRGKIMERRK